MSLVRAVGRNTLIQFGGKVAGTVLGLLTISLVQRYLGATGYGAYHIAMTYLGFLSVLADLGLYMMLIRELSKPGVDPARAVGNLLGLRWISAAVILGLGAALIGLFPYPPEVRQAVYVGTFSFVAIAATQLLVGIFQTHLRMGRVVGAEFVGRLVLLGATAWAVAVNGGLVWMIVAVVAGSLANLILVWTGARRFIPLRPRFDFGYWKQILRDTWPIAISIVLNLIYFRIDTIFLSLFSNQDQVGLYGAAYRVLEILNTFPIMFVGLLLPVLGKAFAENDNARFQSIFQRGFELLCIAAIPLVVGGWILAEGILVTIGGEEFRPAAPALRLLLIAVGALFFNALSGHAVTVINRQRQMVWTYLSVAIIGVIAFLILIPRFGITGAASGAILTQTATAVVGYILVLRVMRFRLGLGTLPRVILSAVFMGAAAWWLRDVNFWLALTGSTAIYLGALVLTRTITPGTIREIISNQPAVPPSPPSA